MIKKNITTTGRVARCILGIILFFAASYVESVPLQIALGVIGMVAIIQGVVGWCGLYALLGISKVSQ